MEPEAARGELSRREPIFHREAPDANRSHFEDMVVADYWEVGASGRRYELDFILDTLEQRSRSRSEDHWHVDDFAVRPLGGDVWLATYVLWQGRRRSRRSTIWLHRDGGWVAAYHQGTPA